MSKRNISVQNKISTMNCYKSYPADLKKQGDISNSYARPFILQRVPPSAFRIALFQRLRSFFSASSSI